MTSHIIETSGLTRAFRVREGMKRRTVVAVDDLSLRVEAGEAVCVVEAMKMENQVAAEKPGTVAEVRVSVGESVGAGDILAFIE